MHQLLVYPRRTYHSKIGEVRIGSGLRKRVGTESNKHGTHKKTH